MNQTMAQPTYFHDTDYIDVSTHEIEAILLGCVTPNETLVRRMTLHLKRLMKEIASLKDDSIPDPGPFGKNYANDLNQCAKIYGGKK